MVDKIDKPEAPPPYTVTSTTETKRDKPQDQKGQEDLPTFKKETPSLYNEKFKEGSGVLKTIRVPLEEIRQLKFRRATPRHGSPTTEADLVWKDGRITENVSFLLQNWQDFLKIKNLKTGEPIPEPFWHYGTTHLAITIWQSPTSGPWNLRELERQKALAATPTPKPHKNIFRPNWTWTFYFLGLAALAAILIVIWKG